MKNKLKTHLIWILFLFTSASYANCISLPFDDKKRSEIDDRQWIISHITINESGEASVTTEFNNGKKVDGDHFSSAILFVDAEENPIASIVQKVGINATYFGNVNRETKKDSGNIDPEKICNIKVEHATFDVVNDQEWWSEATEVLITLIQIIIENGGETEGFSTY